MDETVDEKRVTECVTHDTSHLIKNGTKEI